VRVGLQNFEDLMIVALPGRNREWTKRIMACLAALALCAGLVACGPITLQRAIDLVRPALATLEGTVEGYSPTPQPIVVALWNADEPSRGALRFAFAQGRGSFQFVVPAPGRYRIMAFEDRNGDYTFQPDEPAGVCRTPIMASPGETVSGIVIRIEAPGAVSVPLKIEVKANASTDAAPELNYYQIGQVTTLDDPRFTAANAQAGLWMPIEVIRDAGMGLYFLEPYSPDKTPLLFVHGSGATPADFRFLVDRVDRSRYQPWVYFYPTGMRLERQSRLLYKVMAILQDQLEFKQVCLLAHSMGGLVVRGFLSEAARNAFPVEFPAFVSLGTPWQGHAGAAQGVERSPAVIPAWRDMAPASPFLQELWATPLPDATAYYLLFGYSGGFSLMIDRNNDGGVSLASQLDPKAQTAARRMYGFNEDHGGILASPAVAATVNALLRGEAPVPWVERKNN
jgi:pimeloyl-ACP methyl ester carboxylesterase